MHTPSLNAASSGAFRVNEQGAAIYSIPLSLPQGSAGTTPELSLNYSSQAGNGLLGHGWSLAGVSSITRCSHTLAQDGAVRGIQWDASDGFCYNGQRLRQVGSGSGYREYRTAVDSYTIFRGFGAAASPTYFEMYPKDGSMSTFGSSTAARHTLSTGGASVVYAWALENFSDSVGNEIFYNYTHENGADFRLTSIVYATGTTTIGAESAAQSQVLINYGARLDRQYSYLAGYPINTSKRITSIVVKNAVAGVNGGNLSTIRTYNLHYKKTNLVSKIETSYLAAVQECVSGSRCLPATKFDWALNKQVTFTDVGAGQPAVEKKSNLADLIPFDVDGDGDLDIAWLEMDEWFDDYTYKLHYAAYDAAQNRYVLQPFTGNRVGSGEDGEKKCNGANDIYDVEFCENPREATELVKVQPLDYNGDGRQDLLVFRDKHDRWDIFLSKPVVAGGKLVWRLAGTPETSIEGLTETKPSFVDINSDGLIDVLTPDKVWYLKKNNYSETSSTPNAYTETANVSIDFAGKEEAFADLSESGEPQYLKYVRYEQAFVSANVDFNGDGLGDAIFVDRKFTVEGDLESILGVQDHYYVVVREPGVDEVNFKVIQYLGGKLLESSDHELNLGKIVSAVPFLVSVHTVDLNQDGNHEIVLCAYGSSA